MKNNSNNKSLTEEDKIIKIFFDFIVDKMENGKGGLSQLEADLYNLPIIQQILDNQEKAQKYDMYSQLLESIVRINSDCKTLDEFIQKYQLPKLLVTVSQNGETKIEQLETIQDSKTNAEIVQRLREDQNNCWICCNHWKELDCPNPLEHGSWNCQCFCHERLKSILEKQNA